MTNASLSHSRNACAVCSWTRTPTQPHDMLMASYMLDDLRSTRIAI